MSAIQSTARAGATAASLGPRLWIKKHSLFSYFALAYAITWLSLLAAIVAIQFDLLPSDSSVVEAANQLGAFGPAIAAVVVTALIAGRAGVGRLLRGIVQWRVGPQWYLAIILGVPAVALLGSTFVLGMAPLKGLVEQWPMIFTGYLPLVAVTIIATGLGEEPGWRGFALPRMQKKYGVLLGTFILGIIWQLWHLPSVLFQPGGLPMFALWGLATVVNAFILTWVYNSTGGSILLAILLHAVQNSSSRLVANLAVAGDPAALGNIQQFTAQYYVVSAVSFGLVLLVAVAVTRGRLGYKPAATEAE